MSTRILALSLILPLCVCLGCGDDDDPVTDAGLDAATDAAGDGASPDGTAPDGAVYGVEVKLIGSVAWNPATKSFDVGPVKTAAGDGVDLLPDNGEGIDLELLDQSLVDGVARLKTQATNLDQPEDLMVDVVAKVTEVEGQPGASDDSPWSYGTLENGATSDAVEWRLTGIDPAKPFTVHFEISWTKEQDPGGPAELIVTADYANKYYLIDPVAKQEVAEISPWKDTPQDLRDVTFGHLGKRVYFTSKAPGTSSHELYACDTMTGDKLQKLTSFGHNGLANPDGNPRDGRVVFEAVKDDPPVHLFVLEEEGKAPVQITDGVALLDVPGADDPTVSWGDHFPAWSPDGKRIAYVRNSKDTEGAKIGMFATVVVVNGDGSDPAPVWAEQGEGMQSLCWTHDGAFVVFLRGAMADADKRVLAVHVDSRTVSDLTAAFKADAAGVPTALWCSPSALKLTFSPVETNPDLHLAELTVQGNKLALGAIEKITDKKHYRNPDWSPVKKTYAGDDVGSYGDELPASVIVSANYGSRYYLVDADSGDEVLSLAPGAQGVGHVTLGAGGKRAYFTAKNPGMVAAELFGCDTLTGANLIKLTSIGQQGLTQPDAHPTGEAIVFSAVDPALPGKPYIHLIAKEGEAPKRISGDEQLTVPGADDPTVSWHDRFPVWSPDGTQIAYIRDSKDTVGDNLGLFGTVVVMKADGSDKQVLFAEGGAATESLCWTHDGAFLVFTRGWTHDANKTVRAVHVASGEVSDLTAGFGAGTPPATLFCAPDRAALVYSPIAVNPDLHLATLKADGNKLSVEATSKLTDKMHYRWPDWVALPAAE